MKTNLLVLPFILLFFLISCSDSESDHIEELKENLLYSYTMKITADQLEQSYWSDNTTNWKGKEYIEFEPNRIDAYLSFKGNDSFEKKEYYGLRFEYEVDGSADYSKDNFDVFMQMSRKHSRDELCPTLLFLTPYVSRSNWDLDELMESYKRDYIVTIKVYETYYTKDAIMEIEIPEKEYGKLPIEILTEEEYKESEYYKIANKFDYYIYHFSEDGKDLTHIYMQTAKIEYTSTVNDHTKTVDRFIYYFNYEGNSTRLKVKINNDSTSPTVNSEHNYHFYTGKTGYKSDYSHFVVWYGRGINPYYSRDFTLYEYDELIAIVTYD